MNAQETNAKQTLEQLGFEVQRGGWPDFLVRDKKTGYIFGLEIKRPGDELSTSQVRAKRMLRRIGLEVFVFRCSTWEEFEALQYSLPTRDQADAVVHGRMSLAAVRRSWREWKKAWQETRAAIRMHTSGS